MTTQFVAVMLILFSMVGIGYWLGFGAGYRRAVKKYKGVENPYYGGVAMGSYKPANVAETAVRTVADE